MRLSAVLASAWRARRAESGGVARAAADADEAPAGASAERVADGAFDEAPGEGRDEALERALVDAVAAGRARFAALAVTDEDFVTHVAGVVSDTEPDPAVAVRRLHVADLYLACACARRAPSAVARFEAEHLASLAATLAGGVAVSAAEVDEIRQRLRVKLLVGDEAAGRAPLIATYSGRGPLAAWVRVAAVRLALTLARDANIGARAGRRAAAEGALGGPPRDPELAFLKVRYRHDFEAAFASALGALSDRARALLRMNVVAGLTLDKIGAIYGVDRSTVSRWLADARRALLDGTEVALRARLGVAPAEFQSMARLLTSQLEIDLPELLRTTARER